MTPNTANFQIPPLYVSPENGGIRGGGGWVGTVVCEKRKIVIICDKM